MRMILADDEPVIIRGVQKLVDFEKLGIEIVGEYTDGKQAMEGILALKPDLALLDISMPEMSGVDILKTCRKLNLDLKVIFVSGFQEFEYARAAVQYGAVEYLLKPVIREELLRALEKCFQIPGNVQEPEKALPEADAHGGGSAAGATAYLTVFWQGNETAQMKRLTEFSMQSFLEEYLQENQLGEAAQAGQRAALRLYTADEETCREILTKAAALVEERYRQKIGFLVGNAEEIGEYLFFAEAADAPVLFVEKESEEDWKRFMQLRERMLDSVIAQNRGMLEKQYEQYTKLLVRVSRGKKEDAYFYLCTLIRMLEERFANLGLPGRNADTRKLLEMGRACATWGEMKAAYYEMMAGYMEQLQETVVGVENQDFLKAKAYIENHYDENLTLQVLADVVHMNQYYFSSFFKKNAGENFKDYLNKVRLQHSLALLIKTDMKAYEIAAKTGFKDARNFSENFQRYYHETPNEFRKRSRSGAGAGEAPRDGGEPPEG
ncbi:MAG: response regulator [Eubacteriales bacterium]|nr:response regulator [Eubacteriales bacterium]